MKTMDKITLDNFHLKMMAIGNSGSGKTFIGGSFPNSYFISTEPSGMDTIITNPILKKNVKGYEELIPQNPQDTKRVFEDLTKCIIEAKELNQQGKVQSLIIDNLTYLSENRWLYIETYEKELTNSGAVNTLAMYGKLARWLYQFVLMNLLTFNGNVYVSCHEQLETDEALDKKPDKTCPVLPAILGGFRNEAEGMFSLVLYISKMQGTDKKYHFYARTNKGNMRNAKSRFNLPEIIEDISYQKIMEEVKKALTN